MKLHLALGMGLSPLTPILSNQFPLQQARHDACTLQYSLLYAASKQSFWQSDRMPC